MRRVKVEKLVTVEHYIPTAALFGLVPPVDHAVVIEGATTPWSWASKEPTLTEVGIWRFRGDEMLTWVKCQRRPEKS